MALRRLTASVDGTIPIPALLYNDEDLLASQEGVGIYDGLDLAHIMRTDYYAGLFMSSSKVTLHLDPAYMPPSGSQGSAGDGLESWSCDVCNHRNPPGLSPAAARVCALCGVPRSALSGSPQPKSVTLSASQPPPPVSFPVASSTLSRSSTPSPSTREQSPIPCTACTFLNHPSLRHCEICGTPLPPAPGEPGSNSKSAPSSRPESPPVEGDVSDLASPFIKLSFRKGGDKPLYTILRRALKARAWEGRQIGKGTRSGTSSLGVGSPDGGSTPGSLRRLGIDGILRDVETSAQTTETELTDAFKDLEALMVKAQDLVRLAGELNERLAAPSNGSVMSHTASVPTRIPASETMTLPSSIFATKSLVPASEPEEAKFIRSSLVQLGLQLNNAPVTADMIQDERTWMEELARELAGVLQGSWDDRPESKAGGLLKGRGIIGLDEVWGGWNRARGVALIPPSTFMQALDYLAGHTTPPIRIRAFRSGLQVLHTPPYTHAAFAARLCSYLAISGPQTTSQIAREENITIGLATEMILAVEADGVILRDDELSAIRGGGSGSCSELRWVFGKVGEYIWDGEG